VKLDCLSSTTGACGELIKFAKRQNGDAGKAILIYAMIIK
jgi:hypothetical protein